MRVIEADRARRTKWRPSLSWHPLRGIGRRLTHDDVARGTARPQRGRMVRIASGRSEDTARVERVALAISSTVLLLGLSLAYIDQTSEFGAIARALDARQIVNLAALRSQQDLMPALQMFTAEPERLLVADAVYH